MSGELEAAGAAATAGLAAAAIEGRETHAPGEGACANCGAALTGAYCAQCGQSAHPHRSLAHVFEEFLHGLIHFDTKAWRTLPMVAARPGTLTRNYVYGKRARYISPLALFLFTIFLMFFAFAFLAPNDMSEINLGNANLSQMSDEALAERRVALEENETGLRAQAEEMRAEGLPAAGMLSGAEAMARSRARVEAEIARRAGDAAPAAPPEGLAARGDFEGLSQLGPIGEKIQHKLENPELLLYKVQQNAYKLSFLLVPISLPFVALLFLWKRGVTLYDHVVFVLYSLSFMSLLFVALSLLERSAYTSWAVAPLLLIGAPAHMFFQLKGAYGLSASSALWRTFFLAIFAAVSLIIFLIVIVALGVLG